MPDLAALADPNYRPPKGPACTIQLLLDTLDADTAEHLRGALANPHAASTAIVKALQDAGHRVSANTMQRHRRGECRCGT